MQLTTIHCDPMVIRSVPHIRAGAHKIGVALDGLYDIPASALCLGVQLAEMLGDTSLEARCRVEAARRVQVATREGDLLLLGLCVDAGDPAALAKHMNFPGHAGAYAACRVGYYALRERDADLLDAAAARLEDESGVCGRLMDCGWERFLLQSARQFVLTGRLPLSELYAAAARLSGHFCQGAALDIAHMFHGARFASA